jgi:hypothetical protein
MKSELKQLIRKYQNKNNQNNYNKDNNMIDSFDLLTMLIKYQNKSLINDIGLFMKVDEDELEEFNNDFLKIGFYTPIVTHDSSEEKNQVYIIKKNIKKYKKYKKNIKQIKT